MRELDGQVALVTGAASGIGLGLARAFAGAGMRIALADVRGDALQSAARSLSDAGANVLPLELDVADAAAWASVPERIERALGPVRLLCSNAGVNFIGATHEATLEDWEFCLGVNLYGAIHTIRAFVPRMVAQGAPGHVLITSSINGLFTGSGAGVYATSKFALVGLAESLRADLARHGIGVSVLCPGPVKSELFESSLAVRPAALAASGSVPVTPPGVARAETPIFVTAMTPGEVGRCALRAVRRNDLYVMTHPEIHSMLQARTDALLAALPNSPIDPHRIEATRGLLDPSMYAAEAAKPPPD